MRERYRTVNADAFDWLRRQPHQRYHAVVTDPPFGVVEFSAKELEKKRNGNGGIWRIPRSLDGSVRAPSPRFTVLDAQHRKQISEFHGILATLLRDVLVPGAHVLMASQSLLSYLAVVEYVSAGFEYRGQIVRVVRTMRGGDRPKLAHDEFPDVSVLPRGCYEPWLVFRKPCEGTVRDNLRQWGTGALRRPSRDAPMPDVLDVPPARGVERGIAPHPSLKPQALMRRLVHAALPVGAGVLIDPFMGAGSTIAAASAMGIRSVGIEVDAEYYAMAQRAIPLLRSLDVAPVL